MIRRLRHENLAAALVAFGISALAFACFAMSGCSTPTVSQEPVPLASPATAPAAAPVSTKGWLPEYTAYIKANVPSGLLAYPPESVCPKYTQLSDDAKRQFWADWLESTASPESGFNRLDMFYEAGISSLDSTTGLHNVSEGLLQVSYGDSECKGIFDYASDKAAFLDDYARAKLRPNEDTESQHPERSILDPDKNLHCGLSILNVLLAGHPERPFAATAGRYWSTARDGKVTAYFNAHFAGGCQ